MVFGLALVMALVLGVASMALAGTGVGAVFNLGKLNQVGQMSQLVGFTNGPMLRIDNNGGGARATALDLRVEPGQPPMTVGSSAKVPNLNADKIDGKDSTQIGVNGLQTIRSFSAFDSTSPKDATATCPSGKVVVGSGFDMGGGKSGALDQTDVVVDEVYLSDTSVHVRAYEEEATTVNWSLEAQARCATAP